MRLLRPAALLTTFGLVAAGAVTLAAPASAAATPDTAKLVTYLESELVDGTHYEPFGPGFTDVGLTIDGAFALAATGSDDATVEKVATYLDSSVGRDYAEFDGDPANLTGGAVAKLAVLAEVTHRDPHDFAQLDLLDLLERTLCTTASPDGDPCAGPGNYHRATSVFSQALGIIAQQRSGTAAPSAVSFLLGLQQAGGGFPSLIPDSGDQDPDSTAMAIQALAIVPDADGTIAAAIAKATAYLASTQNADGSWGPVLPGSTTPSHSVNSTGVVLQALQQNRAVAAANASRITAALAFLAGVQQSDGGLPVDDTNAASDVRAATQGLGGVLGVPFSTLSSSVPVTTPATSDAAAAAAATWAVSQLTTGDHAETVPSVATPTQPSVSYVLAGQSVDLAYGLLATGGHAVTVGKLLDYASLSTSLRSNVNGENFGDTGSIYVGPTAKLATVLQLAGRDPRDVGENHLDLIADTVASLGAGGRVHDTTPVFGTDYANVLGQSFAVLALTAAGDTTHAASARSGLLAAQCPDGGFPVDFPADAASCVSVPDATGLAVQALNATHAAQGAVTTAAASTQLTQAVTWLTTHQQANGSYPGAPSSTNTTAYAGMGLLAVGQDAAAPRAYLASIANGDGGLPVEATGDSDFYATAQSLNLLAGKSFLQLDPSVLRPADTIAAPTPPTTTPPTSTAPTPPTGGGSGGGGDGTGGTGGPSGQGGGTSLGDGSLPDTGADVLTPLWLAALALTLGAAATVYGVRRPRRATHAARSH